MENILLIFIIFVITFVMHASEDCHHNDEQVNKHDSAELKTEEFVDYGNYDDVARTFFEYRLKKTAVRCAVSKCNKKISLPKKQYDDVIDEIKSDDNAKQE